MRPLKIPTLYLILTAVISLPLQAREPITDESTIIRNMDFPSGKPLFSGSGLEKQRTIELWTKAKEEREFKLFRTGLVPNKHKTTEAYMSTLKVIEGHEDWVEAWEKSIVHYDDGAIPENHDKVESSVFRYMFNCQRGKIVLIANLFFTTTDATGEPEKIFPWYKNPMIYDYKNMQGSAFDAVYDAACK